MSYNFITNVPSLHVAQSFTRPADVTAYTGATTTTPGDLIANSTTAGSVTPMSFSFPPIRAVDMFTGGILGYVKLTSTSAITATKRVHFFKTTAPTVSAGDNSLIDVSNFDSDKYLGYADISVQPGVSGSIGINDTVRIPYSLTVSGGTPETIYALIESISAFTPGNASTIKVVVGVYRDR